jgi:sec-independent protein translocase protein TatC
MAKRPFARSHTRSAGPEPRQSLDSEASDFVDDLFADTRMSFGDHIEELRLYLWRAITGSLVAVVLGFLVAIPLAQFIARPVEEALLRFYDRRLEKARQALVAGDPTMVEANQPKAITLTFTAQQWARFLQRLGIRDTARDPDTPVQVEVGIPPLSVQMALIPAERLVGRRPALATMGALEAFGVFVKIALYFGVIIASPWIGYQLWSFVAAGLYPGEKRLVRFFLPLSVALFLAGVALCEFVVLPQALDYLLSFNEWMNAEPDLRLNEWLNFALMMPLGFGIGFQLPLAMFVLNRLDIVPVDTYRSKRRMAYFLIACMYLLIGAAPDAYSMMALTLPLWLLYEVGILLCRYGPQLIGPGENLPEDGEMVAP